MWDNHDSIYHIRRFLMRKTFAARAWSILLIVSMLVGFLPVFVSNVETKAEAAISGLDSLTCASFISNSARRNYIDTMMKYYINNYSSLSGALNSGKSVVFMFEGGSDHYDTYKYWDGAGQTRLQAVCIVVQLNSSGKAYIPFHSENCCSLPDNANYVTPGYETSGSTTILDGIYKMTTVNHNGNYAAHTTDCYTGWYTPYDGTTGYKGSAIGINIHTRGINYSMSGGGNSMGCQVIGYGANSSNEYNDFMKTVTGCTFNAYDGTQRCFSYTGSYSGYYVVDRQLGLDNPSGTRYGSGSLIELYTQGDLTAITNFSTNARANASFGYTSECTFYPSYCQVKTTDSTTINSEPCAEGSNDSEILQNVASGTTFTATGIYKNTSSNLWYQVETSSGDTGYLYAGDTTYVKQMNSDITISDQKIPNGHVAGNSFPVSGDITSVGNRIDKATVAVYSGFGTSGNSVIGASDTVSGYSYSLLNSTIDYNTTFNELTAGKYTYSISVTYTNYYAKSAQSLGTNTGTKTLVEEYFVCVNSSVSQSSCSHSYTTTTIKAATCTAEGVQVKSCSKCGLVNKETAAAKGHSFGAWTVTNATCVANGSKTRTCSVCGYKETETITSGGHTYNVRTRQATCQSYEVYEFTCSSCGDYYSLSADQLASSWIDYLPAGMSSSQFNTKTQYRYSDYQTMTSTATSMAGYTLKGSQWIQSGSGTVNYVDTWPSGYYTSNSNYSKYNNKASKVTSGETTTTKTTVNSDKVVGYLYYHWCYADSYYSSASKSGSYTTFHTYYSTTNPDSYTCDTSDMSYKTAHSTCSNSDWFFVVEVYAQSYTTYTKQFTYERWTDFSGWSDAPVAASATRKVETRTVYQLKNASLGTHVWSGDSCSICGETCNHQFSNGVCTLCGEACDHNYINGVCSVCGKACAHDYSEGVCIACGKVCSHSFSGGKCTVCGMEEKIEDFYLFGYINGANYACEEDYDNIGIYKFENGKLVATFEQNSYVAVKTGDNENWFMTDGYQGEGINSVKLYNTNVVGTRADKLYVPKGREITFTLVDNGDGTLTLTYVAAACPHTSHNVNGNCLNCGVFVGHTFSDGLCTQCGGRCNHNFVGGVCSLCGSIHQEYYLFGYINGANYACEEDYDNRGIYLFVDGSLVVTFASDSYVAVKSSDNTQWFMTNGWLGFETTTATLYNTATETITADKLFVPGGVEVTFTLTENDNGTLTLSYVIEEQETIVPPTVTLDYPTLSFEDQIQYNIYFTVSEMDYVEEIGLLTFASRLENGTVNDAAEIIPGYTVGSDTYCVSSNGIPAKNLADVMYFKVYAKLSDGTYSYSEIAGYNAVAYAKTVLGSSSTSLAAKQLMLAMLNYGAAAQVNFDYNTDNLMNSFLSEAARNKISAYDESMVDPVVSPSTDKAGHFIMNKTAFTNAYPTVSFEGAFSINYYFVSGLTPDNGLTFVYWNEEDYAAAEKLNTNNATGLVKMTQDGDCWTACVDGIAAKDMDKTIYVAAIYRSNGTVYTTSVIAYSLGRYCETIAANGNEFGAATAVYGYYAKAYFNNL